VNQLLDQWSRLYDLAVQGKYGDEGEGGWKGHDGRLWLDCLPWCNYLAFDVIGDLAFGAPFGMLSSCQDKALVPVSQKAAMESYGTASQTIETYEIPAIETLNGRGDFTMPMGSLPSYWRPIASKLPWFRQSGKDVEALAGIAIMAVKKRLAADAGVDVENENIAGGNAFSYRAGGTNDLLRKLQEGKDDKGNPMGREELTAEALTLLIAGSDTTSK
jgi:benzoate 4-monooxygenase